MGHAGRSLAWVAVLALFASGCQLWPFGSGDDPAVPGESAGEPVAEMHWLSEQECAALELGQTSAIPLDVVPIDGWPDRDGVHHGMVVARVSQVEDVIDERDAEALDDEPLVTVVSREEVVSVPAPVHPSADVDGGNLYLQFGQIDEDDARWCAQAHSLQIDPLPEALPGEGVVAQFNFVGQMVDAALDLYDTDGQALAQLDVDQVESDLLPAYLLARTLHDDQGVHGQVAELDADELELADRLVARGQRAGAQQMPTQVELHSPTGQGVADGQTEHTPDGGNDAGEAFDDDQQAGATTGPSVTPVSYGAGHDPAVLLQVSAENGGECTPTDFAGLTAGIGRQISGDTLLSGGSELLIDATMFIAGLPFTGSVGLTTFMSAWTTKFAGELLRDMNPAVWERTDFEFSPEMLLEDDVDGGYINAITMEFTSNGWDIGPVLADIALFFAGQVASGQISKAVRSPAGGGIEDVVLDVLDEMYSEFVGEMVAFVAGLVIDLIRQLTGFDEGIAELDSRCWRARQERPDLPESLRTHYSGAIEQGDEREHFVARDRGAGHVDAGWELPIGEALLGVGLSAQTRDATATFGASGEVAVQSISPRWDPSRQQVKPGDVVSLQIHVVNAQDGRVALSDSLGRLDTEVDASGPGAMVTYTVPDNWDGTPILVTAVSLSDTGLRAPSHPAYRGEVSAQAWLVTDGLHIEPSIRCVEEGSTTTFMATDAPLGGAPVDVDWSASAGAITSSGEFTAPSEPGQVTITATAVDDRNLSASVEVTVGSCDQAECAWTATITGDLWDTSQVEVTGDRITAAGVDWETGAFRSLELVSSSAAGVERIVLASPEGSVDTETRDIQVIDHSWDVRDSFSGIFLPNESPASLANLLRESEQEIPGWSLNSAQAQLGDYFATDPGMSTQRLEIPEHPVLNFVGEVTGPVMVGREVTGTVDGRQRADTEGLVGEAIYGALKLEIHAVLTPPYQDALNRDLDGVLDGEGSAGVRTFDTGSDAAVCDGWSTAPAGDIANPEPGTPTPDQPERPDEPTRDEEWEEFLDESWDFLESDQSPFDADDLIPDLPPRG